MLIPNNTKSVVILGWPLNRIFRTQEVCLELGGLKLCMFNRVGVSCKPQNTIQYLYIICASESKFTFYTKLKQGLEVSAFTAKKKQRPWIAFGASLLTILVVLAQEKSRLQYFPEAGTLRKGSAHQVSTSRYPDFFCFGNFYEISRENFRPSDCSCFFVFLNFPCRMCSYTFVLKHLS